MAESLQGNNRSEALALHDAGTPVEEIAAKFNVHPATVYRWIDRAKDGPGPTERAIRALVASWGVRDDHQKSMDEVLIGFAVNVDKGRTANTGVLVSAGVQAGKELKVMLGELGQSSGFEDLRKALLE